jgi:membrane-associated phospholipid phosphatase
MPVLVLYRFRMRQGRYSDPDMSRRSDRNEVYALGAVSMLTAVVVMRYYGAPLAIVQLALDFFLIGAVCGVVNVWWKISMHASAIAAVATIATMQSRSLGIVLWLTAAAVAWARLHTRNHTPGQVAAGTILATVVVYAVHRYMV